LKAGGSLAGKVCSGAGLRSSPGTGLSKKAAGKNATTRERFLTRKAGKGTALPLAALVYACRSTEMNSKTRFNIGYTIAALLGLFLIQYFITTASQIAPIPYSQFNELLNQGKIESVSVSDRFLQGTLKEPLPGGQKQFVTTRVDRELAGELEKHGVRFTGQTENTFVRDLLSWVMPVLLFFGVWWYIGRRMSQSGGLGGGLMSIGKSKAKIYVESNTGVTFADVAGVDEAKDELREIVDFLKSPKDYGRLGGRMPKGVLRSAIRSSARRKTAS
jgi:cell division protease FtsH